MIWSRVLKSLMALILFYVLAVLSEGMLNNSIRPTLHKGVQVPLPNYLKQEEIKK